MSSRDILSQEEVDALLKIQDDDESDDGAALTALDKDVIGEIGNISMGTAATALFSLLNKKVEITAPTVSMTTFEKLIGEYDRPCIMVEVQYIAGIEGRNILIVKLQDAAIIADLMMGGDGTNPPMDLTEMHLSAVGEAMNQMMGSASTSLANMINRAVNISPPLTDLLTLNSTILKERNLDLEKPLVKISFRMKIDGLVDSHIMQLAPIEFVKEMVAGLTSPSYTEAPAPAKPAEAPKAAEPALQATPQPAPAQEMPPMQQPQMAPPMQQQPPMAPYPQYPYPYPPEMYPQQPAYPAPQYYPPYPPQQQPMPVSAAVNAEKAVFQDFGQPAGGGILPSNIQIIEDVPLQVAVQLGKTKMAIKDILELGSGSVIELDKSAGEPVDLLVNGKLVAKGEVVVIDENFGFRVKDIVSPAERLKNL